MELECADERGGTVAHRSARRARRRVPVLHELAERFLERPQPRFVVTPLIDAVGVDRTANLLRADGLHDAGILVELQTLLLERQPAVLEQLAYLRLGIGDQAFVVHAMHPPRK